MNMARISHDNSTLVALEDKLHECLRAHDGVAIARAALSLGQCVQALGLTEYQSTAVNALVDRQASWARNNVFQRRLEELCGNLFKLALQASIDRHYGYKIYTSSLRRRVDDFDADIAERFGFEQTGYNHNDIEFELYGNVSHELKAVFDKYCYPIQFYAVFCNSTGSDDIELHTTADFRTIEFRHGNNLNPEQFADLLLELTALEKRITAG